MNVGVDFLRDPCIEILQYEKYQEKILSTEKRDQCGALLKWILPLDNTLPLAARLLSPLLNSGIGNTSQRSNSSASLVSQFIFVEYWLYNVTEPNYLAYLPLFLLNIAPSYFFWGGGGIVLLITLCFCFY